LARELGERTLLGRQRHGLRQMPGEYRRARLGVALHQRGMDGARRQRRAPIAQPFGEALAQASTARDDAGGRPQNRERHELGGAGERRPQAGAQEARLAGAGGGLDHHEARAAAMADLAQVADAGHDVGLAAEEDAGRVLVESVGAGVGRGLGVVPCGHSKLSGAMPQSISLAWMALSAARLKSTRWRWPLCSTSTGSSRGWVERSMIWRSA
jgi:hypothetical protein